MDKRIKGSITIEMSYIFSIILIVILFMCTLSLYLSDVVSMRAYLNSYVCVEVKNNKTEDRMEKELKNKFENYTYITKVTSVDVRNKNDTLKIKVDFNISSKIININLNNSIEVTGYNENNREYIIKTKVFIDGIKDMGGINIWKWFIKRI